MSQELLVYMCRRIVWHLLVMHSLYAMATSESNQVNMSASGNCSALVLSKFRYYGVLGDSFQPSFQISSLVNNPRMVEAKVKLDKLDAAPNASFSTERWLRSCSRT